MLNLFKAQALDNLSNLTAGTRISYRVFPQLRQDRYLGKCWQVSAGRKFRTPILKGSSVKPSQCWRRKLVKLIFCSRVMQTLHIEETF
jgi:hypothetical protein